MKHIVFGVLFASVCLGTACSADVEPSGEEAVTQSADALRHHPRRHHHHHGGEKAVFCGGIAGIACPGGGTCVDDPSDDCDPDKGGADCGGICSCVETELCVQGSHFDSSPKVCACVSDAESDPCARVRCRAGTHCEATGDAAACVPDEPGSACGDVTCAPGLECCNASCGTCVPPGYACSQRACD